jgi:hypothetical protein
MERDAGVQPLFSTKWDFFSGGEEAGGNEHQMGGFYEVINHRMHGVHGMKIGIMEREMKRVIPYTLCIPCAPWFNFVQVDEDV